jgi:hypothetical protein
MFKFIKCLLAGWHQCVTTGKCWNFRNPGTIVLPEELDPVVFEIHTNIPVYVPFAFSSASVRAGTISNKSPTMP